jgi:hypothetical protein
MQLTPDIQVIRPAQKEVITQTVPITFDRESVGTATVLGLRLQLVF